LLGKKDGKKDDDDHYGEGDADAAVQKQQHKLGGEPLLKQLVFEMRVKNQVIYAYPNVNRIMQVSEPSYVNDLMINAFFFSICTGVLCGHVFGFVRYWCKHCYSQDMRKF